MSEAVDLFILFAEDAREEKRNLNSYMGVFGPRLNVQAFPFTIPKLVIALVGRLPGHLPEARGALQVEFNFPAPVPQVARQPFIVPRALQEDVPWALQVHLFLNGYTFPAPGTVRVTAEVEGATTTAELVLVEGVPSE